jgi:Trk-type K+ transport system membrane component
MGTTSTDAVIKNVGCQGCRSNPRWLELAHRLGLTRRKLKKVVKSGPASLTTCYWLLHVGYYGALTVAGTVCLWWCRGKETVTFVDCLFNAVSALTNTGLSSVLLRDFTPPGLLVLTLLMFLGHAVFVSLLPVYLHRFQLSHHNQPLTVATDLVSSTNGEAPQILFPGDGPGDGGRVSCPEIRSETSRDLERQALVTLSWLVPVYMTVFLCFGFAAVVCYISFNGSETVGAMNPILTAMFLSVSAFSNTGLSPLDENMVPFAGSPLVLGPVAALILAGNCMFPPTLRFTIWGLSMVSDEGSVYKYLLQCPRRCYSLLFPQAQTTWLVATVVAFNVVDLVAFCSLEWRSGGGGAGVKLMDGLFQSLNTRSAGMNVLQLSSLSPPLLVLYTAMM